MKSTADRADFKAIAMFRRLVLLCALVLGFAVPALAAPGGRPVHFRGDDVVRARLILDSDTVSPGGATGAAVELTPDAGWHLYGPEHGDAGAPPQISWTLPHGVRTGAIAWPRSTRVVRQGLTTYEYAGRTTLRVPLSIAADARPLRSVPIRAAVTWYACSNVCVPGHATFATTLTIEAVAGGSR